MSNKKGSAGVSSHRTKVQTHYTTQVRTGPCPAKLTEQSGNGAALTYPATLFELHPRYNLFYPKIVS